MEKGITVGNYFDIGKANPFCIYPLRASRAIARGVFKYREDPDE